MNTVRDFIGDATGLNQLVDFLKLCFGAIVILLTIIIYVLSRGNNLKRDMIFELKWLSERMRDATKKD